ncbi:MAG: Holliday junction resolvase Hjc [Thermosphaera sp.]
MSNRRRGFSHERDLVYKLWSYGLAVVRAPASGSKARRILYPDIVAVYQGKVVAIEAKTIRKERSIYVRPEQVEKLLEFKRRAGGEAFIAIKIVGTGEWRFVRIENFKERPIRITKDMIAKALKLEDLISLVKGVKSLKDFF